MDGSLAEKLYDWPEDGQTQVEITENKLSPRKVTEYHKNQVAYINGMLIILYEGCW